MLYQENDDDLALYAKLLEYEGIDVFPIANPDQVLDS